MRCAGCSRELEVGDQYIEDAASGFMASMGDAGEPELDGMMATILGGSEGKLRYCSDCTRPGGDYHFKTVDEDEERPTR